MKTPRKEADPTDEDVSRVKALMLDTLLGSQPLIYSNVREALAALLRHIGRPKLAAVVESL